MVARGGDAACGSCESRRTKREESRGVPRDLHIQIAFIGVLFRSRATRHPERSFKRIQICEFEARESTKSGRNCSGGCPRD
jgi:hypothetical protein